MDLGLLGGFEFLCKEYRRLPAEIVYATDNDASACDIYNLNFRHKCVLEDIRNADKKEIPDHDILVGGFPCQSFSIVAQNPPRLGYKDRNGRLFREMCNVLQVKKPLAFVAENVKGLLSANNGLALSLIVKSFEKSGYFMAYKILNAADYGVPQKRERVFIVGFRHKKAAESFEFPKAITPSKKVPLKMVVFPENEVDERYYFSDRAVRGMKRAHREMNKGRIQNLNEPCNTINAHLAKASLNSTDPVLLIKNKYRRFTPREATRIQSFPDRFKLVGSDGRQYRAIGNAVPPVLMWHVAKQLYKVLSMVWSSINRH